MVEYKFDKDAFGIVLFASLENENKRRIRVVLDTGATFLMISLNIAEELGCKPKLSKEFVKLTTATSVISTPFIVIKKVDVLEKL